MDYLNDGLGGFLKINTNRLLWLQTSMGAIEVAGKEGRMEKGARKIILSEHGRLDGMIGKMRERCSLKCGSLCCFFNSPHLSAPMSRRDLEILKSLHGERFGRYCTFVPLPAFDEGMRNYLEDKPEFMHTLGGTHMACMLNTRNRRVDEKSLEHKPFFLERGAPMWTTREARACAFLGADDRCAMYAQGVEFTVCSLFACSAFLTVKTLEWLGMRMPSSLSQANADYESVDRSIRMANLVKAEEGFDSRFRDFALDAIFGRRPDAKGFSEYAGSHMGGIKGVITGALTC